MAAVLLAAGLLAGCSDDDGSLPGGLGGVGEADVDVATPALVEQKARLGVEDCEALAAADGGPVDGGLPEVTLPCFGGGPEVSMASLRGPMVLNFWGGACAPCKEEMPALETFHQQHGEQVPILGVDYLDVVPGVAMDLVEETGATYPLVADPGGDLGVGSDVRVVGLPHFVLIDAEGRVVHQSPGGIDSVAELEQMVTEHLGVTL